MTLPVRKPTVAGSFYPAETEDLRRFLDDAFHALGSGSPARAVILPHAGYIYSAKTACRVLGRVKIPDLCFLIGPNHYGVGSPFAIFPEGVWETPLGSVAIDREFAAGLLEASCDLSPDPDAHEREHSLEVELPLLQYRNPKVKIVPLLVGTLDLDWAGRAAHSLVEFLKGRTGFLIVASTDMTHYESDAATRKKDRYALEAIEALDEKGLARVVEAHGISMCGFVPVYMTLILAKGLGAEKAALIDYRTSAEAGGEEDRVVGYAGFVVE